MKLYVFILTSLTLIIGACTKMSYEEKNNDRFQLVQWTGQNSLHLKKGDIDIWVDPFNLPTNLTQKVDYIFITHDHSDHFVAEAINQVANVEQTVIYCPSSIIEKVREAYNGKVVEFDPGMHITLGENLITAVPAYNIVKADKHPKEKNYIGIVMSNASESIYITGDTERIPEMQELNVNKIYTPLGQTYTYNSLQEVADAIADVKAEIVIPVHYGMFEGTEADVEELKKICKTAAIVVVPRTGQR